VSHPLTVPTGADAPSIVLRGGTAEVATGCATLSIPYTLTPGAGGSWQLHMAPVTSASENPSCPPDRSAVHQAALLVVVEGRHPLTPDVHGGTLMLRNNDVVLYYKAPASKPDPAG
jgi:hypothetical protein